MGTAVVFVTVALSVMWLRVDQPDLHRPFREPFGSLRVGQFWVGIIPAASLLLTVLMVGPVLLDMGYKAVHGDVIPAIILCAYVTVGVLFMRAMATGTRNCG